MSYVFDFDGRISIAFTQATTFDEHAAYWEYINAEPPYMPSRSQSLISYSGALYCFRDTFLNARFPPKAYSGCASYSFGKATIRTSP